MKDGLCNYQAKDFIINPTPTPVFVINPFCEFGF